MEFNKYIKKKANASGLSPLRYYRAFTDGVAGCRTYSRITCEKTLAAYKDGVRYKKRVDSKSSS